MELQVRKETEHIRKLMITMAAQAEEAVHESIQAFLLLNAGKGRAVVDQDRRD